MFKMEILPQKGTVKQINRNRKKNVANDKKCVI